MANLTDEALDIAHGLWQRRWIALIVAWGVALCGWIGVAMVPSRYEAQSSVYVNNRGALSGKILDPMQAQQELDATRRALLSSSVLEAVARKTPLLPPAAGDDPAAVAQAGMVLERALSVTLEQDSIIHIEAVMAERKLSAQDNAETAYAAVDGLTKMLVAGKLGGGVKDAAQSLTFLNDQIDARARQLGEAEARRAAFESRFLSGLPGTGTTEERLALARAELQRVDTDLNSAQGSLAAISGQLAATESSSIAVPATAERSLGGPGSTSAIEAQIAEGEARGWTESHPDMIVLRRQLERQRAVETRQARAFSSGGRTSANPGYAPLRALQAERAAAVASLMNRKQQLETAINRVTSLQTGNPELSAQKNRLDRDYNVLRVQYDKLLQDREEVKLSGQAQAKGGGARFSVLEEARLPSGPSAPKRTMLNAAVLVAAVAAGLAAAFLLSRLRRTYAEPGRLARDSGMPVLGGISLVETPTIRLEKRKRLKWFAGGASGLVATAGVVMVVNFLLSRVG